MRAVDRRRQYARFGAPRWVATDVIKKAVPCSLSKTGWHYVTVVLASPSKTVHEDLRQRRHVVLSVRDECEHRPAEEVKAVLTLGGTCCRAVRQGVFRTYMKQDPNTAEAVFNLGEGYKGARAQERKERVGPYRFMVELPEVRWSRLLTQKARKAAGEGFNGISIEWAPKFPSDPWTAGGIAYDQAEMLLRYGKRRLAIRINGVWKYSETAILSSLEDSASGHAHCWKYGGREKDDVCLVCNKAVKFTKPHIRKSRHGKAVMEGIRRAMFALRKPRRPIVLPI